MTKKLMKHWKETLKKAASPETSTTQIKSSTVKVHKTGVAIRDNVISRFFEFFCQAFNELQTMFSESELPEETKEKEKTLQTEL